MTDPRLLQAISNYDAYPLRENRQAIDDILLDLFSKGEITAQELRLIDAEVAFAHA